MTSRLETGKSLTFFYSVGARAGIFTYMTGNWELVGNGLKDRKISPRGRKWNGRLTGNWGVGGQKNATHYWEWTERQENFSTWQEVEGKAEFPC